MRNQVTTHRNGFDENEQRLAYRGRRVCGKMHNKFLGKLPDTCRTDADLRDTTTYNAVSSKISRASTAEDAPLDTKESKT
jgi:hypothetical protein